MAEGQDRPERDASRVIIIDDNATVREAIRALVETDASLRTVGEASNATDGLKLARELHPDLILLDNEMPGTRGIELLPTLRSELPRSRVVMFSMSPSISEEARALGASAVVRKDGGDATLLEALRQVRRGEDTTTVRLATFARLRREPPRVSGRGLAVLVVALAGYLIGFMVSEPTLGAAASLVGLAAVGIAGALLGPALGVAAAILVVGLTAALWTITGHAVDETFFRIGGNGIAAIAALAIGAGSGVLERFALGQRRSDILLAEAIGASAAGGDEFVGRVRSALGCDAAMLFALSPGGRRLRVASTTGVGGLGDERTFLGLPALARSLNEARIIEIRSGDDLVAGARSAAFAPVTSAEGTALGALAVFYRRGVSLTPRDQRRLRAAALAAAAALASDPHG